MKKEAHEGRVTTSAGGDVGSKASYPQFIAPSAPCQAHDLEHDSYAHPSRGGSDDHGAQERAARAIRGLLNGDPSYTTSNDGFGEHGEAVSALLEAHTGGRDVARVWSALCKHNPALRTLVSADEECQDTHSWGNQFIDFTSNLPDPKPLEYIIDRLISVRSLNMIAGAPGGFKTFIGLDAAVCVALGCDWLEPYEGQHGRSFRTRQTPVVWADFDNGRDRLIRRVKALLRARGAATAPIYVYPNPSPRLDATDWEAVSGYIGSAVRRHSAGIVFIDNLNNISGNADENSADMGKILSNFRDLVEHTGVAVVLIHHTRKRQPGEGSAGDSIRGHTSIRAGLDVAFIIEREAGAKELVLIPAKERDNPLPLVGVQWESTTRLLPRDDGTEQPELWTARFRSYETEATNAEDRIDEAIIRVITEKPDVVKGELKRLVRQDVSVSESRFDGRLSELERLGRINHRDGEYGRIHYQVGRVHAGRNSDRSA